MNCLSRFVPLIVLIFSIVLTSCRSSVVTSSDAITGATPPYQHGEILLPPSVGAYEVIGVVDGLKKFVIKYDNTLYRGGAIFADSAAKWLKKHKIRTIISIVPSELERDLCRKNGFTLIEIPFEKPNGMTADDLKRYLNAVKASVGPVYVHCHGGTHRGGLFGVAYRVHIQGWSYEKAIVEYGRLGGDLLAGHTMLEGIRIAPK